jgi:hypothetical protein
MKYEYICRCFAARDIAKGMEKWLNEMGGEGWKLTSTVEEYGSVWWIFVREL